MWCSIAQMGSNRSSNAGVASGIAMHTWIRQHALGAPPRNRALPTPSVALAHEHAAKPHARDRALPANRDLPTPSVALAHEHAATPPERDRAIPATRALPPPPASIVQADGGEGRGLVGHGRAGGGWWVHGPRGGAGAA